MGQRLGARLRAARQAKGLSQSEVARRAECEQSTVSKLEEGGRGGRDSTLRRLAQELDLGFEEIRRLRDLDDGEAAVARAVRGAGGDADMVERVLALLREAVGEKPE